MTDFRGFKGNAKRIEDWDLPRVGATIGVGEDEIHALIDVESSGVGFDKQGRPKMLFEPHVFYRNLSGANRDRAVKEGLAYKDWRPGNYPADSYPRLEAAMKIDETAALKAASWGLGQILGENHKMVGYISPQAMVLSFMDDEDNHLEAMIAFLKESGLDDDLKAHRWDAVAGGYNGPKYAEHNYHGRLKARYEWWRGKPDTPWPNPNEVANPSPVIPAPAASPAPTAPAPVVKESTMAGPAAIVAPILLDAFANAIKGALTKTAADVESPVPPAAATPAAKQDVVVEAMKELAKEPTLQHLTNNEPWYKSRVTLFSIFGIVSGAYGLFVLIKAGNWDFEAHAIPLGSILSGAGALYGRWVATKPLGS